VTDHGSPIVARRRLATELRHLREAAGLTGDKVARTLRWSPSKVSRYELARTGLKPTDVARLLDLYKVDRAGKEELLSLADQAATKGWWDAYSDDLPEELSELIGLEDEAVAASTWQIECVPGLLQTAEYAMAVNRGFHSVVAMPPPQMARIVKARMLRQQVLTREAPLHLSALIDESALLRKVAETAVMRSQLDHLLDVSQLPNVTIQVLPLDPGDPRPIISPSFVVLEFGSDSLPAVAYTEHLVSNLYFDDEQATYRYIQAYQRLKAAALSSADSGEFIAEISRRWS
jgi:transcriptional regulator with XRE-family HTH domain